MHLQKLEHRLKALQTAPLREDEKEKALFLFSSPKALEYISSEESDGDSNATGPRPRKVIKLAFERTKLKNMKRALDEHRHKMLTDRQKRTTAAVRESTELSERRPPGDSPKWAVRIN